MALPTLSKLKIEAFKTSSFKESDKISGAEFEGDFNPSDYTLTRSNQYKVTPSTGTSRPETNYAHGNNDTLSVAFTFDGTGIGGDAGSVTDRVKSFLELLRYRGTIHKPAYVVLTWGDFTFKGVIKKATAKFTLFDREGAPIRAKIDASFEEVMDEDTRLAEEEKSSPDVDRVWRVEQGDRIDWIAYESYGHVDYWWQLAQYNRLSNPRELEAGTLLLLPRLER